MKKLNFYNEKNLKNVDDVFNYFHQTLIPENRTWEYFINWEKVFSGVEKYKIELGILNSLCGSKTFKEDFFNFYQSS